MNHLASCPPPWSALSREWGGPQSQQSAAWHAAMSPMEKSHTREEVEEQPGPRARLSLATRPVPSPTGGEGPAPGIPP